MPTKTHGGSLRGWALLLGVLVAFSVVSASGFAADQIYVAMGGSSNLFYDSGSSVTVYGKDISNGGQLAINDSVTRFKSVLTNQDLTTQLAAGSLTDAAGQIYYYTQNITLNSNKRIEYGTSGGDLSLATTYLNIGSSAYDPLYTYRLSFNTPLNVSNPNVINKKLTILGSDYIIGPTSYYTTSLQQLVLYGSSLVLTLSGNQTRQVTVEGSEYSVGLLGVLSPTRAVISVNGNPQSIEKSVPSIISGLSVYVEDIYYINTTDQTQNSVKLDLNSKHLQ